MTTDRDFINYLLELLAPLDGVSAKRMFGGYGLFRDGLMFGLVADDTLYFKVDEQTAARFIERELEPFTYSKAGKPMQMSYYRAPEETMDSSDEMCDWARLAYDAARRASTHPPKAKRQPKRSSR
ncbi:MAG: TfoX family protein [Caldilinea sp. CFX5]|nr:TfoX family protein [Caldilinea sp. CFX5]